MAETEQAPQQAATFIYSGIDREIRDTLKAGLLLRGLADLKQVFRPEWLTATVLSSAKAVFVDGPDIRARNVHARTAEAKASVPVIWIASPSQRYLAQSDVAEWTEAVWEWPFLVSGEPLDSVILQDTLVETPVLERSGVGEGEEERLAFLEQAGYESSGPNPRLQRIVDWVTAYFAFPLAFVSVIGREMMTAKVSSGLPEGTVFAMPREMAVCQYVVAGQQPVVIPDVQASAFFKDSAFAENGFHAYAGAPLINEQDLAMGTLCMMDMQPREMTLTQVDVLRALSTAVVEHLDDRTGSAQLRFSRQRFHRIGRTVHADALSVHQPLSLASLPGAAIDWVGQSGLDFCTVADDGRCLVCLPQSTKAEARTRLAATLAEAGLDLPIFVVEAQPGGVWGSLVERLTELVEEIASFP